MPLPDFEANSNGLDGFAVRVYPYSGEYRTVVILAYTDTPFPPEGCKLITAAHARREGIKAVKGDEGRHYQLLILQAFQAIRGWRPDVDQPRANAARGCSGSVTHQ